MDIACRVSLSCSNFTNLFIICLLFFFFHSFRLNLATDAIQAVADDLDRAIDDLSSVSSNANVCMGSLAHSIGGG